MTDTPIVDGYRAQTFFGEPLGPVVGVSAHSVVIRRRRGLRLRHSNHAVPLTLVVVHEPERRVTVLAPQDVVDRSPSVEPDQPVDDARIHTYYQRTLQSHRM